jgi:hypothetical protein
MQIPNKIRTANIVVGADLSNHGANLIVLEIYKKYTGKNKKRLRKFCRFQCNWNNCTNIHETCIDNIMSGYTTSCGCKSRYIVSRRASSQTNTQLLKQIRQTRSIAAKYKHFTKNTIESYNYELLVRVKIKYYAAKVESKRKSREFTINIEDYLSICTNKCYLCGTEPDILKNEILGIDRFDNNSGYTMENSRACCSFCNRIKMDKSITEAIQQCGKILNYYTC